MIEPKYIEGARFIGPAKIGDKISFFNGKVMISNPEHPLKIVEETEDGRFIYVPIKPTPEKPKE